MTVEAIARVIHEACKALCDSAGDHSQKHWDQAESWQRESCMKGVEFLLQNPDAPPSASHDAWMRDKIADGWKYGPVKDAVKKEHPCIVPFDQLPEIEQAKDHLFTSTVRSLARFVQYPQVFH
jgi:RyR domain